MLFNFIFSSENFDIKLCTQLEQFESKQLMVITFLKILYFLHIPSVPFHYHSHEKAHWEFFDIVQLIYFIFLISPLRKRLNC